MSKIKTGGLDQYGAGCFRTVTLHFGTAGVEGVKPADDPLGTPMQNDKMINRKRTQPNTEVNY